MFKFLLFSFSLQFNLYAQAQDLDTELNKFIPFVHRFDQFSKNIPQEKMYLHFDNTSYYQGDNIWFKCYVTSAQNQLSQLSKTLYVELLNSGGEIIDKRILKIENGQCHGDFSLTRLPFYSGFYEVRAYTKIYAEFCRDRARPGDVRKVANEVEELYSQVSIINFFNCLMASLEISTKKLAEGVTS